MNPKGLHIERRFTSGEQGALQSLPKDPYSLFEYEKRMVEGSHESETIEVEVPKHWSDMAAHILATHYLINIETEGKKIHENSVKQVVARLSSSWARWGFELGYLASWEDAQALQDETAYMLLAQMAAPNSPQWFNTGIYTEYGIKGQPQGHYYAEPETGQVQPSTSAWERPQVHACFIQSVNDNLVGDAGIMDLWMREARVFKFGSGTGSNFSALRGKGETLEGGGASSGLVSFLKVGDTAAGAIRSGGATRRAAKMVTIDMDHPDILEFIRWKAKEEEKAQALIQAGFTPEDAYETVSGQHANHSVRLTEAFMNCMDEQGEWALRFRTNGKLSSMPKATQLWNELVQAAWRCGDPGLQFHSTINKWNTCKESGTINASNPCAEYLFLDETACNLASLNLLKFIDSKGKFHPEQLKYASRIWTIVLEISLAMGQFPSKETARNTWRYRTLGLGYTGLGAALLQLGMGYGSGKARHWAAAATALITAAAYHTSTEMAEAKGSFAAFEENKNSMMQVIGMHMEALDGIVPDSGNRAMLYLASQTWQLAETGGRFYGFRNAQVTCIAPTGTISLLMDSETTGMEPYYSFDTRKTFSTGKQLRLDFPMAWKKLASKTPEKVYEGKTEIRTAEELSCIHKYADVDEEIGALFTSAMPCPICNHEGLHVNMHIDMIAAIQPFVSGGISKTVNVPHHATQKDISACFLRAYYSGLKSISVYRDGCKAIQPLQQGDCCSI